MRILRVALLGVAHVHVADHLAVLEADQAVELVAVYERDPLSAAVVGGLPATLNLDEAISGADVAVVDSTTAAHAELVPLAAGAGLALFVEKPLADSAAGSRALAAVVDDAGVPFATGMFLRCLPALRSLRALLANGTLGALSTVHTRLTHSAMLDGGFTGTAAWMRQREHGATGGFADLAIHLLDALRWLRPPAPLTVCGAHLRRHPGEDLDVGGAALLSWAGTPTTVHAGWTGRPGGLHLHVEGTLGSATIQDGELTVRADDTYTEAGDPPRAGAALAAFLSELHGNRQWETPTTRDAIATADLLDTITTIATIRC